MRVSSQTGRADLLLALQLDLPVDLALDQDDHHWWGYRRIAAASESAVLADACVARDDYAEADAPRRTIEHSAPRTALRMAGAWTLVQQERRDEPSDGVPTPVLTEEDLRPLRAQPLPYRDLVPWSRAMPGIRRHSDRLLPGAIDWSWIADHMAASKPPRRLPRRVWRCWPRQLIVALDFSPRLDPYRYDFERLAMQLHSQLPSTVLNVRLMSNGPAGPWQQWSHPRQSTACRPQQQPWSIRTSVGSTLVLATDLGLFDPQAYLHALWLTWGRALRQQGCRLIAVVPLNTAQLTQEAVEVFEVVRWSPDSRWHRERLAARAPTVGNAYGSLDALLSLAAIALRVDPPLLRAWRALLPDGGDAGLEGMLWNHPNMQRGPFTCAIRAEHLDAAIERHQQLPWDLKTAARVVLQDQHAHLRRSVSHAEALRWSAAVEEGAPLDARARTFAMQLIDQLTRRDAIGREHQRALLGAAHLLLTSAPESVRRQSEQLFGALDAAVEASKCGQQGSTMGEKSAAPVAWRLIQQGDELRLVRADVDAIGQALGTPVLLSAGKFQVAQVSNVAGKCWIPIASSNTTLARLADHAGELSVAVGSSSWALKWVDRPWWAEEFSQQSGMAFGSVTAPSGEKVRIDHRSWDRRRSEFEGRPLRINEHVVVGVDQMGVYAEVDLVSESGAAGSSVQLLVRWIPPGRFEMGSADGEGDPVERPKHHVLLSQGFWLHEVPCTQSLWFAVMGTQPSRFSDYPDSPRRPVESVSADDVDAFLRKLGRRLPSGCSAALPTEAQWEYAARAGSTTAYTWGNSSEDNYEDVNWAGQHGDTTPVGAHVVNPWGLKDMTGNVWEWCADGQRSYTNKSQTDPSGPLNGPSRVVRGGSWFHSPESAASSFRGLRRRSSGGPYQGFRIALLPDLASAQEPGRPRDRERTSLFGRWAETLWPSLPKRKASKSR